jgi:hypothetical protein
MIPVQDQGVIAHINPVFAKELKRRKLQLCIENQESCWLHQQQALWRIYYTERDRTLMEEVWQLPSVQESLQNMLSRWGPGQARQPQVSGQSRSGPYGQRSLHAFFSTV